MKWWTCSSLSLLALAACSEPLYTPVDGPSVDDSGEETSVDDGTDAEDTDVDAPSLPEATCAFAMGLEIVPLDIWGRDLSGASLTFDRTPTEVAQTTTGPGVVLVPLDDTPASLTAVLSAPDHEVTGVEIDWSGEGDASGFRLSEPSGDGRVVASLNERTIGGALCPVYTVYLGVNHPWFAASGRAPTASGVTFYMDGEEAWLGAYDDLVDAQSRVTWSTWWWESDFELVRPDGHVEMSEWEREAYTAMSVLDDLPGVERRILINRFWGETTDYNQYLNTDGPLRDRARATHDDFEVMLQGNLTEVPVTGQYGGAASPWSFAERVLENPRYAGRTMVVDDRMGAARDLLVDAASWHQKAIVIDGEIAHVSGMNTKATDWDTTEHAVFDARRMAFDASRSDRRDVEAREELPDLGPRKDYGVRIAGPGARDVESLLWDRWELGLDNDDLYADRATPFSLDEPAASPSGAVPVQIVATMPEPFGEMSILETHIKAIEQAEDYLYIEDQYFRSPLLQDAIVARMSDNPELLLIVVTKPVGAWDGGAKFSYLADATFRDLFPDRYLLLQLQVVDLVTDDGYLWDDVDLYVQPIDTHSKLRLVDDVYLSVGSCNVNNRGYLFEGELNASVLDEGFTTRARRRVFENLVGPELSAYLSDDPQNNFDLLRTVADYNAELLDWWDRYGEDLDADEAEEAWATAQPYGFVYPLEMPRDYRFDVGPDLF